MGELKEAEACWRTVVDDAVSVSFNRHLVAKGLLGELPADPVKAEVPNRSDHRLLYCLFLGFRYFVDWKRTGEEGVRKTATGLLRKALRLQRPSYDIYSATESFARIPLTAMGHELAPPPEPEPLSRAEEDWLDKLTMAASEEEPNEVRRPGSSRRRRSGRRRRESSRP